MNINLGNKTRAKIITAVLGQLSDGMWENSPAMNKYWAYATIDGVELVCNTDSWNSGFYGKDEEWIRNWFASKLKAVVQDEVGNNKQGWSRDNMQITQYISYHNDISVSACYECYDFLKGRKAKTYAFQLDANAPGMKEFKKVIKDTIDAKCKDRKFEFTEDYDTWVNSILDYFEPHFKLLWINDTFDYNYLSDLEGKSERYDLAWPRSVAALKIIEASLRDDSSYWSDLTIKENYTMVPDDCIKAFYFGEIRDPMFRAIYKHLSSQ